MKEMEITINNGEMSTELLEGFGPNDEAEDIVAPWMRDLGFKQKTAHKPHNHGKSKDKVHQGIGIR